MNIEKLLLLAVMPMVGVVAQAQTVEPENDYTPKKKDVTVATTLKSNSFTTISAPNSSNTYFSAPYVSGNMTQKQLGLGFELGYFTGDSWKWTLGGGFNFSHNPGYPGIEGTSDMYIGEAGNAGSIPTYNPVAKSSAMNYEVYAGVDKYHKVKYVPNLLWYSGVRAGLAYGLDKTKTDEPESNGVSSAETYNFRGDFALGVEYYVAPAIFIGAQISPVSYS